MIYRVEFTGYGINNTRYLNQTLDVKIPHDWSYSEDDAYNVMLLIRKAIKEHLSKYVLLILCTQHICLSHLFI